MTGFMVFGPKSSQSTNLITKTFKVHENASAEIETPYGGRAWLSVADVGVFDLESGGRKYGAEVALDGATVSSVQPGGVLLDYNEQAGDSIGSSCPGITDLDR